MGVVRFYHLTRSPLEDVVARLASRAFETRLRVEVRGTDPARLETLDRALWLGDPAGFLPHGIAGGPHDALQPILLTGAEVAAEDTTCVMAVDGGAVDAAEAARLDRTFILFDGNDASALAHARGQWKILAEAGAETEYWSEETGRWERKR